MERNAFFKLAGPMRGFAESDGISPRLLVFPFAGGSCLALRPFLSNLEARIDIRGVEYPGRGIRAGELPVARLDSLVEEFADTYRKAGDVPTLFLGYSFGALVAYELALRLKSEPGPRLLGLIAISAKAPHFASSSFQAHALPDQELIEYLRHLDGTSREVLDNIGLMELFLPAIRADMRAYQTYERAVPFALDCPVVAIRGSRDPVVAAAHVQAWRDYGIQTAFQCHEVAGGHFCHRDAPAELGRLVDTVVASLAPASLQQFQGCTTS